MAARAVAVVEETAGGIELVQGGLELLSRGTGGAILGPGRDELLGPGRVAQVVELALLVEFPFLVGGVPVAGELDEDRKSVV